jgi:hypothetical protein
MKKGFDSPIPLWYKVRKIGAKNLKKGGYHEKGAVGF